MSQEPTDAQMKAALELTSLDLTDKQFDEEFEKIARGEEPTASSWKDRAAQAEVQLAGCGAAAMGHIEPRAKEAKPGDYGYSASYEDVVKLRHEVELLRAQVTQLQEANTRLLEEKRAHDEQAMVRQFHRASGSLPVRHTPCVPADEEVRFRLRLNAEEFMEQFEACFKGALQLQLIADVKDRLKQLIDIGPLSVDFEELVDAWADLKYVIIGGEITFGVDGNAVFRVVHEANLSKFTLPGGGVRPDGKVIKPKGFKPPDIAGELERQRCEEAKRA